MFTDLFFRFRSLFCRGTVESELDEELRFHLEHQVEKYIQSGLTREEAMRRTRLDFGGLDQVKENCRDARGVTFVETLAQDVGYALRTFRRNTGFTVVAVVTLALGIGANTAIFSVIDAVMLRTLPVHDPAQLVQVAFQGMHSAQSFVGKSFSYPLFRDLRQENQVFTDLSAFDSFDSLEAQAADRDSGAPGEPLKGQLVSANFFSMLGVNAVLGRAFLPEEESAPGDHPVAVISYAVWERAFARDPHVLGKRLLARGTPLTVIGVAPRNFSGVNPGQSYDLWTPLTMSAQVLPGQPPSLTDINTNWLSVMGRLKTGISARQAMERLDLVYQEVQRGRDISQWSDQDRRDFFTHRIVLLPAARGTDYLRQEFSRPLSLLMGMVGLVLLIACANVTNLQLARADARENEIAVRMALGAGGRRLLRQFLTESVLLALASGLCGMILAYWGSRVLVALMSITLDVRPDLRVLTFTSLLALIAGIAAGLAPAIRAARRDQIPSLRVGSHKATVSRSRSGLGRALVVAQMALSLVVVFAAVLLVRTLRKLERLDPGFSRQNVLLFRLEPNREGYKDQRLGQLYEQVVDRIGSAPGVRSASYSFLTPISGGGWDNYTSVEGYTPGPDENMDVYLNAVGPRFFETLGIPLMMGRSFGAQDRTDSKWVAVINQAMARRFFPDRNPIGRHFGRWKWNGGREYEIIGVVGDAKYLSLREEVPPTAYLNISQSPNVPAGVNFEVSSVTPNTALVPEVRRLLESIDPRLIASDVKTLAEQVEQSLGDEKLICTVSTCFGGLALVLACIGLYGLMSYTVARRTSEIGIRMALGAAKGDVFQIVIQQGLRLVFVGLSIGVVAALVLSRLLYSFSQLLYGIGPNDPPTIIAVSLVLAMVAILACYIPALRAVRVDPMFTLRSE